MVYQFGEYQNILKLSCRPFAYTSHKAFLKGKSSRTDLTVSPFA